MIDRAKSGRAKTWGVLLSAACAFGFGGCATPTPESQCSAAGLGAFVDCATISIPPTPMQAAASKGDDAAVKTLMSQGVNPGEVAANGYDSISSAVDHPDLARRMLEFCVSSAAPAQKCPKALYSAAMIGDETLARALTVKGADIDAAVAPIQKDLSFRLNLAQTAPSASMSKGPSMQGMMALAAARGSPGDLANRRRVDADNRGLALLNRLRDEKKPAAPADASSAPGSSADGAAKPWWSK